MKPDMNDNTYKQAEKRVQRIKKFYNHLQVFVIMMLILLLFSNTIIDFFEIRIQNENSLRWIKTNIWFNALLWFIGLAIHGIFAFKYKANFIDKWEKKKVNEFMNKND